MTALPPLPEKMTTPQVAEHLGLKLTVLRYWLRTLKPSIPRDDSNEFRWTPDAIEAMRVIKQLRDSDRGMETVRRVIRDREDIAHILADEAGKPPASEAQAMRNDSATSPQAAPPAAVDFAPVIKALETLAEDMPEAPSVNAIAQAVADQLRPVLADATAAQRGMLDAQRQLAELGERYAQAAHHIGRLEGERAALAQQLTEARALLAAPPAPPPPSFWQRLFGRR